MRYLGIGNLMSLTSIAHYLKVNVRSLFMLRVRSLPTAYTIPLGVIFMAAASQLCIPMYPVPMTMQMAAVCILGLCLPPKEAMYTITAYVMAGLSGLPVFHNFQGGPLYVFSPTIGYIVGWIPMCYIISRWARLSTLSRSIIVCSLANLIAYAMGISVLSLYVGFTQAILKGFVPFAAKIPFNICIGLIVAHKIKAHND